MKRYMKELMQLRLTITLVGIAVLVLCLTPLIAWAAEAAAPAVAKTQAWWQAALMPVLSALGLAIAAFMTAGLKKLTQLIEKKWSVDIPDSVERLLIEKARWLLAYGEEAFEKRLLHGDGKKTARAEQITTVVKTLKEYADSRGYGEEWTEEKLLQLAEGVLHLERDVAIGSNGSRGKLLAEKKETAKEDNE